MNLKIECPSCQRAFTVHEDLTGKKVECGGCDHQFKITPKVMTSGKEKFYPGEHRDHLLDRFAKTPAKESASTDVNFQTANYNEGHSAESVMPAKPSHNIALTCGLSALILFALIYLVNTSSDQGVFKDIPALKRYLLAGFICVVSAGMIIYGAKNWRFKGLALSLLLSGGIFLLIAMRGIDTTPSSTINDEFYVKPPNQKDIEKDGEKNKEEEYFKGMLLDPIQDAINRAEQSGVSNPESTVVGIFFYNYNEGYEESISDHYRRGVGMGKNDAPLILTRGEDESLLILSSLDVDFDVVMSLTEDLGRAKSYPERHLIVAEIDNKIFSKPSSDLMRRLMDPYNPAFYSRNLAELDHVNFTRVEQAVERLGIVPDDADKKYTPEISQKLLELIRSQNDQKFRYSASKALMIWGKRNDEIVARTTRLILQWYNMGKEIPVPLMNYVVLNKSTEVAPILDKLWLNDPIDWREPYENLGSVAEPLAIKHLASQSKKTKIEAIKVIGNVGGRQSLRALSRFASSGDAEIQIRTKNAIKAIQERLGQ